MIRVSVLPNTDVPAYRQIYEQLAAQILSGALPAGTALPPIRSVSKEIGLSVITVRGAWDALEADGLIETRVGSGCYVASLSETDRQKRQEAALQAALMDCVRTAVSLGYSEAELIDRVREAFARNRGEKQHGQ